MSTQGIQIPPGYKLDQPAQPQVQPPSGYTLDIPEGLNPRTGASGRFIQGFGEAIDPTPMVNAIAHPLDTGKAMLDQTADQYRQSGQSFMQGNPGQGMLHAVEAVPMVGPMVGNVANKIGQGDYAGALGYGTGLALPAAAGELAGGTKLPEMLQTSAEKQYAQALNPTKAITKDATQKVVPELLNRKTWAFTYSGLSEKAQAALAQAAQKLDDVWTNQLAGKTSEKASLIQSMNDVIDDWTIDGAPDPKTGIPVKISPRPEITNALAGIRDILSQYPDLIPVEDLRRTRQIWDKIVAARGGYQGGDLITDATNYARREGGTAIRKQLAAENPDIVDVNKEYSFWQNVNDILDATKQRRVGQQTPISERIMGAGGLAGGLAMGGGLAGGAEVGIMTAAATKLFRSTGYRTISANVKSMMADALASGNVARFNGIVTAALNSLPRDQQEPIR